MKYYPLYLNLKGQTVLLVGGGDVAWQKIPALLECEARVRVVAPDALPEIRALAEERRLEWAPRAYAPQDLDQVRLVIAATDDPQLQKQIAAEARARQIWVNVVDVPPLCDFIAPATVSQGDIQIAISTGGASPALAKFIRQKLEPQIGPEYGELAQLAHRYRPNILKLPQERRRAVWDALVSQQFLDQIKTQGLPAAENTIQSLLNHHSEE